MFNTKLRGSLSRRGSKLLVEMIIGVIGILGIMLAQSSAYNQAQLERLRANNVELVNAKVSEITPKIDWQEILF